MQLPSQNCWFLTGATAVGKTQVGLALAERLEAEIISLDSMAIYRGMDIGTAKPSPAQQAQVPHHLIDIMEADELYSACLFAERARQVVVAIEGRGRVPIVVGGSGLYLRALLQGIGPLPPSRPPVRRAPDLPNMPK